MSKLVWFFFAMLLPQLTLGAVDQKRCVVLVEELVGGQIPDFNIKFRPKFRIEELDEKKGELRPKNPKYLIQETGQSELFVENRMIDGISQIVTVKYSKLGMRHMVDEVRALVKMRNLFRRLHLLKYFDVILPVEFGENYAVYPYLQGKSLPEITYDFVKHLNPPLEYKNTHVSNPGPPRYWQDSQIRDLWTIQQERMRMVIKILKKNRVKVSNITFEKSWFGVKYIDSFSIQDANTTFTIRDDMLVTTDGRFVITDPY